MKGLWVLGVLASVLLCSSSVVALENTDTILKCIEPKTEAEVASSTNNRRINEVIGEKELDSKITGTKRAIKILYGDVMCASAEVLVSSAKAKVLDSIPRGENGKVGGLAGEFWHFVGHDTGYENSFKEMAQKLQNEFGDDPPFSYKTALLSPPGNLKDRVEVRGGQENPLPVKGIVTANGPRAEVEGGDDCNPQWPVSRVYVVARTALKVAGEEKGAKSVALPVFGTNKKNCAECVAFAYTILAADDYLESVNSSIDTVYITLYKDPKKLFTPENIKALQDVLNEFSKDGAETPHPEVICGMSKKAPEFSDEIKAYREQAKKEEEAKEGPGGGNEELTVAELPDTKEPQAVAAADNDSAVTGGSGSDALVKGDEKCDADEKVAQKWMDTMNMFTDKLVECSDKARADPNKAVDTNELRQLVDDLMKENPLADKNPEGVKSAWDEAFTQIKGVLGEEDVVVHKHEHIQQVGDIFMKTLSAQLGQDEMNEKNLMM